MGIVSTMSSTWVVLIFSAGCVALSHGQVCLYRTELVQSVPRDIIARYQVSNVAECSAWCNADENCKSFTHIGARARQVALRNGCILFGVRYEKLERRQNQDQYTSGVPGACTAMCEANVDYHNDRSTQISRPNMDNFLECS